MRFGSSWLLILAFAAFSAQAKTLLGSCPTSSDGNISFAVCFRDDATNNVTTEAVEDPRVLSLSKDGITAVEGFPTKSHLVDLSSNSIQSISTGNGSDVEVMSLNLANNGLAPANIHDLPSTISYLDLSFNAFDRLSDDSFNWLALPRLTSLNLSNNNIRTILLASFPSTLTTLDLSNNPIQQVLLTNETYRQLARGSVKIKLYMSNAQISQISSQCGSALPSALGDGLVCVVESASYKSQSTEMNISIKGLFINLGIGIALAAVAAVIAVKVVHRRIDADWREAGRETISSSASCEGLDDLPMQYRESVTPTTGQVHTTSLPPVTPPPPRTTAPSHPPGPSSRSD
ncbi:hypothetical protein LEN26_011807 [Aphanomyces euteiches]|nr:hypothetical protein LEN26_011807 [Aphanomyces euteiches]